MSSEVYSKPAVPMPLQSSSPRLDRAREVHASIQARRAAGRRERVDGSVREGDVLSRRRAGLDLRRARGRDVLERRQRFACGREERVRVIGNTLAEAR